MCRAHVVAERDEINGVLEDFFVFRCNVQHNTVFAEIAFHVTRVSAAYMYIGEEIVLAFRFHRSDHIVGMCSQRIGRHRQHHAADLEVRIDFVTDFRRQSTGDQFMVHGLIQIRLRQLVWSRGNPAAHEWRVDDRVDFIERQPVFDFVFVAREDRAHVVLIEADHFAVDPAVVFAGQVQRRFVM